MFGTTAQPTASTFNFGGGTPAAASSGFSFGTAPTPASTSGGFNFGGAATPAAGSSGLSFNGPAAPTAATASVPSSGFSFGGTSATVPSASSSGFNFGSTGTASTSSNPGLSGTGTAATPAPASGFNFGGTNATPAASNTGFNFGGTAPATNSFGFNGSTAAKPFSFNQTTAPNTGFSFGAKPTPSNPGFGFNPGSTGTGTTSTIGTPNATGSSLFNGTNSGPAPGPIIIGADASVAQLNTVKAAYQDPAQSRFKFLMYNTVDPMQRHLYTRPPNISERLWNQAELDNPDPFNCAPVPILGFEGLLKRIKAQQEHAGKYNQYTEDLRAQLFEMDKHMRATEEKLEKCRHEHVQLFHALVKCMRDIELLQNYGKPLQREEMQLAMALKKLQTLLDSPGQYKARLNDAVSMQRVQKEPQPAVTHQLSPQDLQQLYEFMDKQRQGLEHLTNILNDDLADIKLIQDIRRR